jgi:hypothetical protein
LGICITNQEAGKEERYPEEQLLKILTTYGCALFRAQMEKENITFNCQEVQMTVRAIYLNVGKSGDVNENFPSTCYEGLPLIVVINMTFSPATNRTPCTSSTHCNQKRIIRMKFKDDGMELRRKQEKLFRAPADIDK